MIRFLAALALALWLSACSTVPAGCLRLTPGSQYCPAFKAWPEFETTQSTVLRFRGQSIQLITRMRSDEQGVLLIGLSPLGQTVIRAAWQDGQLTSQLPPGLAGKLDPAFIPGLLELALAPAEQVRQGLRGDLTLNEQAGHRTYSSSRGTEIEIRWQGSALPYPALRVAVPGLDLTIDSTALEADDTP